MAKKQKKEFQAEVSKILDIVAHSLYSEKEVFLRELISNASDACDKLRYESLTQKNLVPDDHNFKIVIELDQKNNTMIIRDNGIGMNEEDLISNLGTIARSGTAAFLEQIKNNKKAGDPALIGQFGVGFYSAFMVANKVEVHTRKAGEQQGYIWSSDGTSGYEIASAEKDDIGTIITLHMKKDSLEYLQPMEISGIVKKYSDHIEFPIELVDGEKIDVLNEGSALWAKDKKEITEEQYQQFYHHIGAGFDSPLKTIHWKAEGVIEYTGLLFIPGMRPFDLFDPQKKHGVKLYVKKIFITEQCEGLIPNWLRFLRGVIDSSDLPLNISREMLQHNPLVAKIKQGIINKALSEFKSLKKDPQVYESFWKNFGSVIKEGLYEQGSQQEKILDFAWFQTTKTCDKTEVGKTHITLKDYVARMKENQDSIYYLTGDDVQAMKTSPQLEAFLDQDIEVLLLSDTIDEFWIPIVGEFNGKKFVSITKDSIDLPNKKNEETSKEENGQSDKETKSDKPDALLQKMKDILKEDVKDIRFSKRLTQSAVCLVSDTNDADLRMEKLMRAHQGYQGRALRIMEINPDHELIKKMENTVNDDRQKDYIETATRLLLDQARITEGELPDNPSEFSKRLNAILSKAV